MGGDTVSNWRETDSTRGSLASPELRLSLVERVSDHSGEARSRYSRKRTSVSMMSAWYPLKLLKNPLISAGIC